MIVTLVDDGVIKTVHGLDILKIERDGIMMWEGQWRNVIDVHRQWEYLNGKIDYCNCKGVQIELDLPWNPWRQSNDFIAKVGDTLDKVKKS